MPAAPDGALICYYAPRKAVKLGGVLCRAKATEGTRHQTMQTNDTCLPTLTEVSHQLGVCIR